MRPEILYPLFAEARTLPGLGPKSVPLFEKLGVRKVGDALFLAPTGVIDRRLRPSVRLQATVTDKSQARRPRRRQRKALR